MMKNSFFLSVKKKVKLRFFFVFCEKFRGKLDQEVYSSTSFITRCEKHKVLNQIFRRLFVSFVRFTMDHVIMETNLLDHYVAKIRFVLRRIIFDVISKKKKLEIVTVCFL